MSGARSTGSAPGGSSAEGTRPARAWVAPYWDTVEMSSDSQKRATRAANQALPTTLSRPSTLERKRNPSGSLATHSGVFPPSAARCGTALASKSARLMAPKREMTVERAVRNLVTFTSYSPEAWLVAVSGRRRHAGLRPARSGLRRHVLPELHQILLHQVLAQKRDPG